MARKQLLLVFVQIFPSAIQIRITPEKTNHEVKLFQALANLPRTDLEKMHTM
jgi:hypothetical protein